MHYAPNKALERTFTRLHALRQGGILVPAAQRRLVMRKNREERI
jgi:hypothetical protein